MISNTKKTIAYLGLLGFLITSPLALGFTFIAPSQEPIGEANVVLGDKTYTLPITQCGVYNPFYAKPTETITDDGSISNYVIQAGKPPTENPPNETHLSIYGKKHIARTPINETDEKFIKKLEEKFDIPKLTPYEKEQADKKFADKFASLLFVVNGGKHYIGDIMEDLTFKDNRLYYAGIVQSPEGDLPLEVSIKCDKMVNQVPPEEPEPKPKGKASIILNGDTHTLDVYDCGIPNRNRRSTTMPEQDKSIDHYVVYAGDEPTPKPSPKNKRHIMIQGGQYLQYPVTSEEEAKKIIADLQELDKDMPIPLSLDDFIMTQEEADKRKKEIFAEIGFTVGSNAFYKISLKEKLFFNDRVLHYNGMVTPRYRDNTEGEAIPVEIIVDCKLPQASLSN